MSIWGARPNSQARVTVNSNPLYNHEALGHFRMWTSSNTPRHCTLASFYLSLFIAHYFLQNSHFSPHRRLFFPSKLRITKESGIKPVRASYLLIKFRNRCDFQLCRRRIDDDLKKISIKNFLCGQKLQHIRSIMKLSIP